MNEKPLDAVQDLVQRFDLDRDEAEQEGFPEALFDLLSLEKDLPGDEIKDNWISEGFLEEETRKVKKSGFETMEMETHRTYYEEKNVYIPSEQLLNQIYLEN